MRRVVQFVVSVLIAAAALWVARPLALGDPGGVIALADKTFPAALALRAQYYPWAAPAANPAVASKPDGPAGAAGANTHKADKGDTPGKTGKSGGKGGPAVVMTQPVVQKSVPVTFTGVGTVQPIASIQIRPRLDSQIVDVVVAEGSNVKQGDLLFRLDDRSLKAQLAQADAQIQKDQALLEQNKRDLTRAEDLLKQKFLTAQSRETIATTLNQTKAQIAVDTALKSGIATSLSYLEIHAPLAGRIGSIAAKTGAFVRAGDILATVNQIDPIYVAFALPQARIGELRDAMNSGNAEVRIKDAPGSPAGSIAFMENTIDASTGTVQVKASMPNPAEKLWPGAFANLELQTGVEDNALTVPSIAVLIGQNGPYVFAVVDKKAVLKPIVIARTNGADTMVTSGVSLGDEVVVQGQGGLTDGADVRSKNDSTLKTSSAAAAKDG